MEEKKDVYYKFRSKMTAFLYILILVVFALLCLFPISFVNVEPSSSLFSLCLLSPFLCVAGILLPTSATEHAENPSIDSLLRTFSSITPLLQVLVITSISRR